MNLSKPSDDFVSSGLPNPMHTPVLDPSTLDDEAQVPSSMGSEASDGSRDEDTFLLPSQSLS